MNPTAAAPNTKKFYQLVNIKDFRIDGNCADVDYSSIAEDCDNKTASIIDAIQFISLSMSKESTNTNEIRNLSGVIFDLAELAIATNKISQTAAYLSGIKDANHGA
ncbi:hypothetical protein OSC00_00590 [Citrobacter freundii]|uniref:hypothetical protein n=1 Tax=Citrobacter freundii TaxID=546 RepID=UPI002876F3C7|nr:hypothetical protein [Citrobacter freundii]MDS0990364.1 hypothetical protein [Citrobacter freundii]